MTDSPLHVLQVSSAARGGGARGRQPRGGDSRSAEQAGHGAVAPDEELLLRLDEDDLPYSFDWCESIALYVIIARDALARADFSATRAHLGCTL